MKYVAFLVWLLALDSPLLGQKPEVVIGIVIDGPSEKVESGWLPLFEQEILALLDRDFVVRFPEEKTLRANWTLESVRAHLAALLADPEVDLVLCGGVLATFEAAAHGPFEKPVVAPFGINSDLPVYPNQDGVSGVKNFNYQASNARLERDAAMLVKLKQFKKLHFVANAQIATFVAGLREHVQEVFAAQGLEVEFVLSTGEVQTILDQLPANTEFVYITPLLQLSDTEKVALFQGLAARRIPSFSMLGKEEVKQGVLGGLSPESDRERWARRVALNVQRILLGEDASGLPVLLSDKSKLSLNMATAREIGWYPSWDLQISAELIHQEPEEIDRRLTLSEAVDTAIAVNLDFQEATREIALGERMIDLARAQKRLRLDANLQGVQVDGDSADASLGSQAETTVSGSLALRQALYSDGLNAQVSIQEQLQKARVKQVEATKLDIALETALRFLNYLKARNLTRIQKDNLDLTNTNLETARIRFEIGSSGPADVYRWESQYARDQQEAIAARAQADSALAALNQILHFPQEALLDAVVPDLLDPEMITGQGRLRQYVDNARDFEIFRGFMVAEGLKNSPELARIDAILAAKQREVLSNQRRYYLPTVSLQGQLSHDFSRSGGDAFSLPIPGVSLPQREDTSWSAVLNFSLPVFEGGARKAGLGSSRIEVERLKLQRRSTAEKVELSIRTSLQRVGSASAAINLSRVSAEAARKNYELVKDAYATGLTSILDLLDAQNAALQAERAASNALYDFLIELMRFQRASANFDFFRSPEQREAFFYRLDELFRRIE